MTRKNSSNTINSTDHRQSDNVEGASVQEHQDFAGFFARTINEQSSSDSSHTSSSVSNDSDVGAEEGGVSLPTKGSACTEALDKKLNSILEAIKNCQNGKALSQSSDFKTLNDNIVEISSKLAFINSHFSKTDKSTGQNNSESLSELCGKIEDVIEDRLDAFIEKLNNQNGNGSNNGMSACINDINVKVGNIKEFLDLFEQDVCNYRETINQKLNELNSKISSSKDAAVKEINKNTNERVNGMNNRIDDTIKKAVSSSVDKISNNSAGQSVTVNMAVTVISVVVLMLSAIFMSLGFAVRYVNGLPLALSWSAMAFLCASLSWTIVLLVFRNTEFEEYMEDYILQFTIPFGVFLLATFILSLLSLVLL